MCRLNQSEKATLPDWIINESNRQPLRHTGTDRMPADVHSAAEWDGYRRLTSLVQRPVYPGGNRRRQPAVRRSPAPVGGGFFRREYPFFFFSLFSFQSGCGSLPWVILPHEVGGSRGAGHEPERGRSGRETRVQQGFHVRRQWGKVCIHPSSRGKFTGTVGSGIGGIVACLSAAVEKGTGKDSRDNAAPAVNQRVFCRRSTVYLIPHSG